MCLPENVLLPCDINCWSEIKCILQCMLQKKMTLAEKFYLLYDIESLFHINVKRCNRLKIWPASSIYTGLGNFIKFYMGEKERKYFELHTLPFILDCVVMTEMISRDSRPSYCSTNQKRSKLIQYDTCTSIVACSFLCLLPTHPKYNQCSSDFNFTSVFLNIFPSKSLQVKDLWRVVSYFEFCRTFKSSLQGLVVSHRSWSCLDLQRHLSDINGVNAFSLSNYDTLRGILSYARLPLLLVDNILNEEQIALEAHLPTVHFMRPHVGGVLFDGGISQAESLFSKYPDLISIIPSYQNLSDGESLWIDHYRGPFLPETLGAFTAVDRFTEEAVKWRRLVLLNSNQYPTWMSEIHYSTQCLINEIIFVTAGLSPDGLKSKDEHIRPEIFSSTWWDYLKSKSASGIEQRYTKSSRLSSNDFTYSPNTAIECVQTTIAKSLVDYADKFISGVICESLNKLARGKTNKLSNSGDRTLLKKSQIGRCHSNQRTSSVFTPLNSSDLSGKLCKNIFKSTEHHFNPSYKTSSCINQCKITEQGKLSKPIVYYASDLVKEFVNYAQNVSTLRIHQLNVYSDKLVANILQSANKLLKWSNHLSKQILTEVKYSNNLGINYNIMNQNVMNSINSITNKEVVENNKTNTTNSEKHPMNKDFQQCRMSQSNNHLNSHEKYSILNKDNSLDDQSCQTMIMDSEMKIVEESSLKPQAMKDIKKSDNCIFPKTDPIIVCKDDDDHTNSKKSVFKFDGAKHKLPQIFVSENISEFANSLVVKCITLAFGEIYIQRMSSYLNHGSFNSETENNNNNDLDNFESKYYNSSNIRPPGLILDAIGEEYPSNYYSDPQMKVLIQWISAALVYSSPCSKFNFLANKMNSSTQDKIDSDYNHSSSELNDFKNQIAMEHSCSPLICCTNGDVKLKKLQTVVSLVYKASWNAGDLFCAMLDYCHYRSEYLAQTTTITSDYDINNNNNIIPLQCNYSLSPQLISKPLLSLFDFLILQLQNIQ